MENFTPYSAMIGGVFIGISVTILLWFNGKIAGVSGIFNGAFEGVQHDTAWRWWFLFGLVLGASIYVIGMGLTFVPRFDFPIILLAFSGFLVGFGTRMGSGCTSGHGVCGIARLSPRSLIATTVFLLTGIVTTTIARHLFGII